MYKECLRRHDLTNLINLDTSHPRENVDNSGIDYFCTNNPTLYSQCGSCPFTITGHDIIYASRKKFKEDRGKTKIKARKYSNLNEERFKHDIDYFYLTIVYQAQDVDTAWNMFINILIIFWIDMLLGIL